MLSEKELDRQKFEAWFVPKYHPRNMRRNKMDNYYFMDADIAWTAWQARGAELPSLDKLILLSEIADFFAGLGSPGETETPEEMQEALFERIEFIMSAGK